MNLRTSKERVDFLRMGFSGKELELLYIQENDMKIVNNNILREINSET